MRGKTRVGREAKWRPTCFNEAPAECGGNKYPIVKTRTIKMRFNEAPAECGGKLAARRGSPGSPHCFNEAPAECGGKPGSGHYRPQPLTKLQ